MADSPSAGGKTSPGPVAGAYGPNEYERFGKGRTPDQYKEEELANVDQLKHESDAELERKRAVFLALMFEARALGNPHGLAEFNEQRLDKISGIIQHRTRRGNWRATIALWISGFALLLAAISIYLSSRPPT